MQKYYVERDRNGDVVTLRANAVAGMDLDLLPENHADIKKFRDRQAAIAKGPNLHKLVGLGWAISKGMVTDMKTLDEYDTECQALFDKYAKE